MSYSVCYLSSFVFTYCFLAVCNPPPSYALFLFCVWLSVMFCSQLCLPLCPVSGDMWGVCVCVGGGSCHQLPWQISKTLMANSLCTRSMMEGPLNGARIDTQKHIHIGSQVHYHDWSITEKGHWSGYDPDPDPYLARPRSDESLSGIDPFWAENVFSVLQPVYLNSF